MKRLFQKILAAALYIIPIIFFAICYFLITTSAEDINQGAGLPLNILHELKEAFLYNPRLGELYTWPMINAFDYQFIFGADTLLRLFDVLLAVAILITLFMISTARMPRLRVQDAVIFAIGFLLLILATTQYSEVFYARFSFIHNYLMIILFFLLFTLPYALEIHGKSLPKSKLFFLVSSIIGFLFGMSSQVTPVVVLMVCAVIFLFEFLTKKSELNIKKILTNWKIYSIVGILAAEFVMYGLGPGIASHYANDPLLNYVSFSDLLAEPLQSIKSLAHNLLNNTLTLLPYILLFALAAILILKMQKNKFSEAASKYLVYVGLFCIVHLMILSQISFGSLLRATIPIYIAVVLVILFAINLSLQKIKNIITYLFGMLICALCLFVTFDMTYNQIVYRQQVQPVLSQIQQSPSIDMCVPKNLIKTPTSILKFHQSPLLEEWAMPMKVYNKNVTFCKQSKVR